jgi:hypothetical protein
MKLSEKIKKYYYENEEYLLSGLRTMKYLKRMKIEKIVKLLAKEEK